MKKIFTLLISIVMLFSSISLLIACGSTGSLEVNWEDDETKEYNIVYYLPYNAAQAPNQASLKEVETELSKLTKEKINATVTLQPYLFSEYTNKLNGAIAAAVPFDLCYTSPGINPYATNVARYAFVEIPEDKLQEYAPETYSRHDEQVWDQVRIGGKIYATLNEQIFPKSQSFSFQPGTVVEQQPNFVRFIEEEYPQLVSNYSIPEEEDTFDGVKDGIDFTKVTEFFTTDAGLLNKPFEFIDKYFTFLEKNKLGYGTNGKPALGAQDFVQYFEGVYRIDPLARSSYDIGAVDTLGDQTKVINQFESDQFKELIAKFYEWKQKGWLGVSVASGKVNMQGFATWKPSADKTYQFKICSPFYLSNGLTATMNAISSTSKNPARTLKFIELLSTDKDIHNLLQYGIEGKSYKLDPNDSNRISEFIPTGGYDMRTGGWALGTEFISYLQPGQPDNLWEETKKINDETPLSDVIGFTPDLTDPTISQLVADCRATVTEFCSVGGFGNVTYDNMQETLDEFYERLDAAGADRVIAEIQKQLDAFYAEKTTNN